MMLLGPEQYIDIIVPLNAHYHSDLFAGYTDHAGLKISVNSCIASFHGK